ncbi:FAD dependent oxidoreductase [Halarsenatibacter silvermanii]|uniref:FAD dependent oxidoreductase n=2 Tax=Halarsenatibacter silvermanii TaxID=321763 RepID=A0A1G9J393_9FIRM|nr:FAD dependent oxidoreductase [Halarsenatibacter silvermanii]
MFKEKKFPNPNQMLLLFALLGVVSIIIAAGPALLEGDIFNGNTVKAGEADFEAAEFDEKHEIIVLGLDPEGIAAAVASARSGRETLLIGERRQPGGLMVQGGLNTIDMNFNPEGDLLTQGLFAEFYHQLEGISFNTSTALRVFRRMIREEEKLSWINQEELQEPVLEDGRIVGIITENKRDGERNYYAAERFIDASQGARLAAQAGVPYIRGMEDIGLSDNFQAATLVFQLDNVNWHEALEHLRADGDPHTGGDHRSLWGFWDEMQTYENRHPDIRVRGLNVGRQSGDRVLINALQIPDVDPFCQESRAEGRLKAFRELEYLVEHIRENVPGFSEVELAGIAEELYIRQDRQIEGIERLDINDAREHRVFDDMIGMGSYPVDIQRTSPEAPNLVLFNPAQYSIPFQALVPEEIDGLLVVGKSASYGSQAHGSARVIPVGMVSGEAAGVAGDISLSGDLNFREMAVDEDKIARLQSELISRGAYLDWEDYSFAGEESWALEGIRFINGLGLIQAGYDNEFGFEEPMPDSEFVSLLETALIRAGPKFGYELDEKIENINFPGKEDRPEHLTKASLSSLLSAARVDLGLSSSMEKVISELLFMDRDTAARVAENDVLTRQASYQILLEFFETIVPELQGR